MTTKPAKPAKPKTATGRPSSFTQAKADAICTLLVEGKSLRSICKQDDMPGLETVRRWLRDNLVFRAQYARAREEQADALFDECLDIADTPLRVPRKVKRGGKMVTEYFDSIEQRRLQIDVRKWMAGKLRPKAYGDKLEVGGGGKDGAIVIQLSKEDMDLA